MNPLHAVLISTVLILMMSCKQENESKSGSSTKPNIIFIYDDDLGRGLLSKNGQKIIKTPNIDKLAEEGKSFNINDPDYISDDYWRGRIWAPMNFLVYLGFRNYKLNNAQQDLVKKSKELLLEQWLKNGYVCENYNSQTGECDDVKL